MTVEGRDSRGNVSFIRLLSYPSVIQTCCPGYGDSRISRAGLRPVLLNAQPSLNPSVAIHPALYYRCCVIRPTKHEKRG